MSLFIALLLAQVPPPPSGRPLARGDVEVLEPIVPALTRYNRCVGERLSAGGPLPADHPAHYRQRVDQAIGACSEIRASAMAEAEASLSRAPDYQDAGRRSLAIRHAFDGSDQVRRDMPTLRALGTLPAAPSAWPGPLTRSQPLVRLDIPNALAPAVVPYLNCLLASNGIETRRQSGVQAPPPGMTRGSDCAPIRRRAAIQGDILLERSGMRNRGARRARVQTVLGSIEGFARPRQDSGTKPDAQD